MADLLARPEAGIAAMIVLAAIVAGVAVNAAGRPRRARSARFVRTLTPPAAAPSAVSFDELAVRTLRRLVGSIAGRPLRGDRDSARRAVRMMIEHLVDTENPLLNRVERERLIETVLDMVPAVATRPPAGPVAPPA